MHNVSIYGQVNPHLLEVPVVRENLHTFEIQNIPFMYACIYFISDVFPEQNRTLKFPDRSTIKRGFDKNDTNIKFLYLLNVRGLN